MGFFVLDSEYILHLGKYPEYNPSATPYRLGIKLLLHNIHAIHIPAWFFEKRFKLFFEKVLVPKWNLEDWWYRFEWQHRGTSHVYDVAKRKDAPVIYWNKMKDDE